VPAGSTRHIEPLLPSGVVPSGTAPTAVIVPYGRRPGRIILVRNRTSVEVAPALPPRLSEPRRPVPPRPRRGRTWDVVQTAVVTAPPFVPSPQRAQRPARGVIRRAKTSAVPPLPPIAPPIVSRRRPGICTRRSPRVWEPPRTTVATAPPFVPSPQRARRNPPVRPRRSFWGIPLPLPIRLPPVPIVEPYGRKPGRIIQVRSLGDGGPPVVIPPVFLPSPKPIIVSDSNATLRIRRYPYFPIILRDFGYEIPATVPQPVRLRRAAMPLRRRLVRSELVRPQLNPPYPVSEIKQPRNPRGVHPRQVKHTEVTPLQTAPIEERKQNREPRGFLRRKGRVAEVTPLQFNPPYPFSEIVQPHRMRGIRGRRGKLIEFPPNQQAAAPNPLLTWPIVQARRLRGLRQQRGQAWEVTPPQFNPPYPFQEITQSKRRGLLRRKGRIAEVVPPQIAVALAYPYQEIAQPRRLRGGRSRRGSITNVVPGQVFVPNPSITFSPSQVRRLRGMKPRQVKKSETVRPQLNPPFPFNMIRFPRVFRGLFSKRTHRQGADVLKILFFPPSGNIYTIYLVRPKNQFADYERKYMMSPQDRRTALSEPSPRYILGEPRIKNQSGEGE
jgi:hypothetical protein